MKNGKAYMFWRERGANVGVMAAIFLPVTLALGAVAIDRGSLHVERRQAQAATDLAAIAAAASPAKAADTALAVLAANGVPDARLVDAIPRGPDGLPRRIARPHVVVTPGRYVAGAGSEAADRFTPGGSPANAARVTVARTGTRFFGASLIAPPVMSTTAVGASLSSASFSIGSRLASLNGGIANAVLGALLGAELSLEAMDYDALLEAEIGLDGLLGSLARKVNLTAASYDELLATEVSPGLLASAIAASPGLSPRTLGALSAIERAASGPNAAAVALGKFVGLGTNGGEPLGTSIPGLEAKIGVMELLAAAGAVAQGGRQVSLDLGASIPGLARLSLDLAIGEPPQFQHWFALGEAGTTVRTAQTRLSLVAELGGSALLGARIKVPLYVELAFGEASLADVACSTGHPDSAVVTVGARPGVVEAWLGEVDPAALRRFSERPRVRKARLLDAAGLVRVTGSAHAAMDDIRPTALSFSASDIASGKVNSVATRDFTRSLTGSLLRDLSVEAKALGLGLGPPSNLTSLVASALETATPALDRALGSVLAILGLKLGEADIRVHSVSCGRPVLVQ